MTWKVKKSSKLIFNKEWSWLTNILIMITGKLVRFEINFRICFRFYKNKFRELYDSAVVDDMMNEIGADDTGESGLYVFVIILGTYKERYLKYVTYPERHFAISFQPWRMRHLGKKCRFAKKRHLGKKISIFQKASLGQKSNDLPKSVTWKKSVDFSKSVI